MGFPLVRPAFLKMTGREKEMEHAVRNLLASLGLGLTMLGTGCAERAYMAPNPPVAEYGNYGEYDRVPYYREPGFSPRAFGYGWGEREWERGD